MQQPRANTKSVAQGGKRREVVSNVPYYRSLDGTRKAVELEKLSMAHDLRVEQVETLLCFLEVEESKPVRSLPPVYKTCEISFTRSHSRTEHPRVGGDPVPNRDPNAEGSIQRLLRR